MIQNSGETVKLDLPASCASATLVASPQCTSVQGCFQLPLNTNPDLTQWSLIGTPLAHDVNWDDLRITASNGVCASVNGCTLPEAQAANVFHHQAWRYNNSTNSYDVIKAGSTVSPWDGMWSASLPGAEAVVPKLLIP